MDDNLQCDEQISRFPRFRQAKPFPAFFLIWLPVHQYQKDLNQEIDFANAKGIPQTAPYRTVELLLAVVEVSPYEYVLQFQQVHNMKSHPL